MPIIHKTTTKPLRPGLQALYDLLLTLWANREDEYIRISNHEASMILGCHPDSISRNTRKLNERGYIHIKTLATQQGFERRIWINEKQKVRI